MTAGRAIVATPQAKVDEPRATGIISIPTYSTKSMLKSIMILPQKSPRAREMVRKTEKVEAVGMIQRRIPIDMMERQATFRLFTSPLSEIQPDPSLPHKSAAAKADSNMTA